MLNANRGNARVNGHARERRCRLLAYLVGGDPTCLEWLLGTLKTAWGTWLLLPFHAFAASAHLYRYALAEMPEAAWGSLLLCLGSLQWVCWYYKWQKARFYASVAGALFWERLGWLMWQADHRSVALVFLSVLSLGQILAASWLYGKAFPSSEDRRRGYDQM